MDETQTIVIEMPVEEFAVFIDCETTVYNRLTPDQRTALRNTYDRSVSGRTALWYKAMDKLTEIAKATF